MNLELGLVAVAALLVAGVGLVAYSFIVGVALGPDPRIHSVWCTWWSAAMVSIALGVEIMFASFLSAF